MPTSTPHVLTVTELNLTVAKLLEKNIPLCWIAGEVSNFTRASSGHWYFTLKDSQAQVRAVMFKSRTMNVDFMPKEGEKIEVRATVSLYAPRGDYQLSVENIRRAGMGNLYEEFIKLKQKLSANGLFDADKKLPIPRFVKTIGIITSPQAAGLKDILITLNRRAPHCHIIIYPTPVQGIGAGEKIAQAITIAAKRQECDCLIVARGGGSIEDLWAFNEEVVAHAIAACAIPLITGVGHETDFTIADFVADVRAPTPTAAAEIAVTAQQEWLQKLADLRVQLHRTLDRRQRQYAQMLDNLSLRLISPKALMQREQVKLRGLQQQLKHNLFIRKQSAFYQFSQLKQRLIQQKPNLLHAKSQLNQRHQQLHYSLRQLHQQQQQRLTRLAQQLELLNPQRTLERGYAILLDKKGKVIQDTQQLQKQQHVNVKLKDGELDLHIALKNATNQADLF